MISGGYSHYITIYRWFSQDLHVEIHEFPPRPLGFCLGRDGLCSATEELTQQTFFHLRFGGSMGWSTDFY